MNKYKKIAEAREILELPERATMASIKSSYRHLLAKWHPDKCGADKNKCAEMTRKIISAYQTIMDYCDNYKYYSFTHETIKRHLSPEEWWSERFGDDPLWGKARESKE